MMEKILYLWKLAQTLIPKPIQDEFYKSVGSKLGETAVEKLPEKVKQLGRVTLEFLQDLLKTSNSRFISEQGINYCKLRDYLKKRDWQKADYETYLLMLKAVGKREGEWITGKEILKFPSADLRIIDELWIKYSQGKFGFSIQNEIWNEIDNSDPFKIKPLGKNFARQVGWLREKGLFKEREELTFQLEAAPRGHLPCTLRIGGGLREESGHWLFASLRKRLKTCSIL